MILLSAIKKLFMEYDSKNSTWIAEVAMHMKTTPHPFPFSFIVHLNSLEPKRSTAID
jgi:hypothetical protein